ncbi:SpoIIE family protein phosphatase [Inquilinus sp. OTU3971]|uniref:SpoIIE family protein phosphatase n=1 Tax=Inquilinus sp. OTU3971 TaxID=3043855 RepID=UPI00313C9C51
MRVPAGLPALGLRSFRAKFIAIVGTAVLFDLLLSSGLALWNVQRLSSDATVRLGEGLTEATEEYMRTYAVNTARDANLLINQVHAEVNALADVLQSQIGNPGQQAAVGEAVARVNPSATSVAYDEKGGWAQNRPGSPSVVSVWGYLLGPDRKPLPAVQAEIDDSAVIDLVAPSLMAAGSPKLQMYYIGPKTAPIFRTIPYTDQAQTFDRLYPGHNTSEFWTFFFPGLYESWERWLAEPGTRPVGSEITMTAPYTDAITGKLIVSFFRPLVSRDHSRVAGVAGTDITLDQLAEVVKSVRVADTGFGFLAMSNGNVLAIESAGEKTLGLVSSSDAAGQGVTAVDRSLRKSIEPAVASLSLDAAGGAVRRIELDRAGTPMPYVIALYPLSPVHLWSGGQVASETMSVGIVVPESEIYAPLHAAQQGISQATKRIIEWQIAAILLCMIVVLGAIVGISKRITAGLSALADGARKLQAQDYSVRVDIPTRDEVGEVGLAFNRMAEEIRYHTENLERLVEERTVELARANEEISGLNAKLADENLRLGAELDVARHIQQMVLPKRSDLDAVPEIEIAAFMQPADEVGGDYYDVLRNGSAVKVGIGDVTGHGLESGVLMLMVQSVARALHEAGETDPKTFLSHVNQAIFKNIERTGSGKHLSLAFLDVAGPEVVLTGQHEDVIVVRSCGEIEILDTVDLGFPVGLEPDISRFIETKTFYFGKGDLIVLYTDGVTEAVNGDGIMFGMERLCKSIFDRRERSSEIIKSGVIGDLLAYIGTEKIHDDITLVVLRHK